LPWRVVVVAAAVRNDFQLILIDRPDRHTGSEGDDFDIEFNYNSVKWDTGVASGGGPECLNQSTEPTSAYAGYTNGLTNSYELPGSGEAGAFLDSNELTGLIYRSIASGTPGRYLFAVERGEPATPPPPNTTTVETTTTTTTSATTTPTTSTTTTTTTESEGPILAQRVIGSVTSGTISVRLKGKSAFEPFSSTGTIPDGSEVEATNGHVLITVATPNGGTETAEVWGGRFLIHQERSGETRFTLTLPLTGCPRVKLPKGSAAIARTKHRSGPKSRHLWVSENGGSWGTDGRYVITTVVGTHWLTEDECSRSRVSVVSGKVRVRNLVNNRTKTLTAGQSYVARRG
jgi:hypothetical protein